MDSKFLILTKLCLIGIIQIAICYEVPPTVTLKGGLIYESGHKPIQVNSNYMTFHRQLNISLVSNSVKLCDKYISRYTTLCNQLMNSSKLEQDSTEIPKTRYFVPPQKVAFEEATSVCKSLNGIIPEPRLFNELIELNKIMTNRLINEIPIGIYYNVPHNRFQYISDNADVRTVNLFQYIMYKNGTNEFTPGPFHKRQEVKDAAINNLIYAYKHHNIIDIAIPPMEKKIPLVLNPQHIICQELPKPDNPKKSILTTIANMHCLQSVPDLTATNDFLQQELTIFTSAINNHSPIAKFKRESHNITKRFAPALVIPSVIGVANTLTSAATGEAPLSWFGNLLSKVFGFPTESSMSEAITMINQHSTTIQSITINQNELISAYNALASQLRKFSDFVSATEYTASYLFNLIDNRFAINKLQNIIQFTFLKIAEALTAAMTHATSPYILSESELKTISHSYKGLNIHLTTDISQVYTTAFLLNGSIYFTFHIPILEEKLFHHLYQVTPVPIYAQNSSFIPEIDAKYIALSITDNYYSILTSLEYSKCISGTYCSISDIQRPNDHSAHCVISTYFSDKPTCPLVNYTLEDSFFKVYGNQLIYSTNGTLPIHLRCPQKHATTFQPITINLSGMGKAHIADGCSITLQNNKRFSTLSKIKSVQLDTTPFMNVISNSPNISLLQFKPLTYESISIPIIHVHNHSESNNPDLWQKLTRPTENIAHIIRTLLTIIVICTLLSFMCIFSRKIRIWFKTCIFWKNPRTWWTTYKQYDISTFQKRSDIEKAKEQVRQSVKYRPYRRPFNPSSPPDDRSNTLPPQMSLINPNYPSFRDSIYPNVPTSIYESMHNIPTIIADSHENDQETTDHLYSKPKNHSTKI